MPSGQGSDSAKDCAGDAHLRQGPTDLEPDSPLPGTQMLGSFLMSSELQDHLALWVELMQPVSNQASSRKLVNVLDVNCSLDFATSSSLAAPPAPKMPDHCSRLG